MTGSSSQEMNLSLASPFPWVASHQMATTAPTMTTAGPTELELVPVAAA